MASIIKLKRSSTAGALPSLQEGEVAVNLKDKILYVANSTATFELARNTANNGLTLHDGSGNEIRIVAPSISSNYTLTLPIDDGAATGYYLETDGSGNLSWSVPGGGGDVTAVGTPVDNQLSIWTGTNSIEGNTNLTYNPSGAGQLSTPGLAVTGITSTHVVYADTGGVLKGEAAFVYNEGTDTLTVSNVNAAAGGVTTAITDTQLVYSASGVLSGDVDLTYNSTTNTLNVENIVASGNLTVLGTTTTLDVDTVAIQDPIIKFANNNVTDGTIDIGFYGRHGAALWSGLFRDADDTTGPGGSRVWKLRTDMSTEPTTVFPAGTLAQLDAVIDGGSF